MNAMNWLKWICFSILLLVLTGCMETIHSVQIGTVDQEGAIQLLKSESEEDIYQKALDTFNNGRNIKLAPSEVENLKTHYIQFKDDNQNLVISNYNVWFDHDKNRIIFTDHVQPYSYYRIVDNDKDFLRNLLLNDEGSK
ncbi:hypothetical protein ACIQ4I_00940 [Rummeliibacillus sp. NPDC094406]|uniref:hypothetical protein n=1 Tax=Rummeliibacillus sp. NPDC094406 TaxID=3364511 RepID=UPI0037F8B09B